MKLKLGIHLAMLLVAGGADRPWAQDRLGEAKSLAERLPSTVDATCRDRFLREAPDAWESLHRHLSSFEVDIAYRSESQYQGQVYARQASRTFCILKNPAFKLQIGSDGSQVAAANNRYSFNVLRNDQQHFYLKNAERWVMPEEQPQPGFLYACSAIITKMHSIWWIPVETLLANRDFRLIAAKFEPDAIGRSVARIVFRYQGQEGKNVLWHPGATSGTTNHRVNVMPYDSARLA